jgi:hypothetical protein
MRFISYALKNWKIDMSDWTEGEKTKFNESAEMMRKFQETDELVRAIGQVKREFYTMYNEIGREAGVPSVFGHSEVE